MSKSRPNLLFLMTDHQRADSLGMVQGGVEVTPNLNRLAGRSCRFTRAYNTCPLCAPARTALATGRYPTRTGIPVNDFAGVGARELPTLHRQLAEAGYEMGHIGVHHVRVRPDLREGIDWSTWFGREEYAAYAAEQGVGGWRREAYKRRITERHGEVREAVGYSNTRVGTWPGAAGHFMDARWGREAAGFLRRRHAGPLALFVHLWAPHPPLVLPEPYAGLFDPERLELPENVGLAGEGEPANRRAGIAAQLGAGLDERQWRGVWAAHLGLVRLADDALGGVLDALDTAGLAESTVTCFTVDHGDMLGQHGMYQKMELYEPAVRVPLLLAAPDGQSGAFDACVSHLDVLPTLCDLLGVERPGDIDGVSLAATVREGERPAERTVFSQYSGNPVMGDIRRGAITRRWKYVFDPDAEAELYDLAADPQEMTNLAGDPSRAETLSALHAEARRWHEGKEDWVRWPDRPA